MASESTEPEQTPSAESRPDRQSGDETIDMASDSASTTESRAPEDESEGSEASADREPEEEGTDVSVQAADSERAGTREPDESTEFETAEGSEATPTGDEVTAADEAAAGGGATAEGEETEEPDPVPPGVGAVRLPVFGELPLSRFRVLIAVCGLVFLAAAGSTLLLWPREGSAPDGPAPSALSPESGGSRPERQTSPLPAGSYAELMKMGDEAVQQGRYRHAARCYGAAAEHSDEGISFVLLARHKRSRALVLAGRHAEALKLSEELQSVSRPGDPLWKHALVTALVANAERKDWGEFFRLVCLLRANSARYDDEENLNRWLSYARAMGKVRLTLPRLQGEGALYGRRPPSFGRAPSVLAPLRADQIVVTTGNYGDGSLEVRPSPGELRLRSDGAPLDSVLGEIAAALGLDVEYSGPGDARVVAELSASAPQYAVEMALGAVGLKGEIQNETLKVSPLRSAPASTEQAVQQAQWALQEFLILYPESPQVPEAYYALGLLYMLRGRPGMGLDQFRILTDEYPRARWATLAHYMAGRAYHEQEDWRRGKEELMLAADQSRDESLIASANLWGAQCMVELQHYEEAARSFRRALAHETDERLAPRILYNIAYCMEQAGAFRPEVEQRYLEVRTRYPQTRYARMADYRLARMPFAAGNYRKAMDRYEAYLDAWPAEDQWGRNACRDLLLSYVRSGYQVRAVLLGDGMGPKVGFKRQYWEALPSLLMACYRSGLHSTGLDIVEHARKAAPTPRWEQALQLHRARYLIELKRYEEAERNLKALAAVASGEMQRRVTLERMRLKTLTGRGEPDPVALQKLAAEADSPEVRERALRMAGENYEQTEQYARAARVYAGEALTSERGGAP